MIYQFSGKVVNGKLKIRKIEAFKSYLLTIDRKEVYITVKDKKSQRSLNQNKYYWGVPIKIISQHTGHSPDEIHELLKSMFLKEHIEIEMKEGKKDFCIVKPTTSLTTKEMEEYLEEIRMFASLDLGLVIPLPNEVDL